MKDVIFSQPLQEKPILVNKILLIFDKRDNVLTTKQDVTSEIKY